MCGRARADARMGLGSVYLGSMANTRETYAAALDAVDVRGREQAFRASQRGPLPRTNPPMKTTGEPKREVTAFENGTNSANRGVVSSDIEDKASGTGAFHLQHSISLLVCVYADDQAFGKGTGLNLARGIPVCQGCMRPVVRSKSI